MKKIPDGETLLQLADRINRFSKQIYASRLEFCRALAEARLRVVRESNMTWEEWVDNYLRKPNGDHWSVATIRSYVYFGRKPEMLEKKQKLAKKSYNKSKKATKLFAAKSSSVDEQVYMLLQLWKRSNAEAKKQFLALINCSEITHKLAA